MPSTHTLITLIGALTLAGFLFLHPENRDIEEIAGAFTTLAAGYGAASVGKGYQRKLQGGIAAPDTINAPSKETDHA